MTILNKIYHQKLWEVCENKKNRPLDLMERHALKRDNPIPFGPALRTKKGTINIIAEVKKASPSLGIIRSDFHPIEIAKIYESCGVAAVSVLTDEKFFQGSLKYLTDIKQAVRLPILRKDFIIDPYQIYEAYFAGADAILLIATLLSEEKIQYFLKIAEKLSLDCLVEVHSEAELKKVLQTDAHIIGINNRDLNTFTTDINTTFQLSRKIPEEKIIISESGINTRSEIKKLQENGIHAVLIGETFMKCNDISAKIRELKEVK